MELADESPDTTHFSVVDRNGMAVSNTYTLEARWGSRIVVAGAGFVLNNEMGDFNWFPGVTNREGRIGTAANTITPGKRMLSSQTPTMVEKDGRVVLVTGSPGGRTIINTVLCIVLGITEFDMSAVEAVTAPRMHHQWFPDRIQLEDLDYPPHLAVADALRKRGHQVVGRSTQGSAHSIAVDSDTGLLTGIADYRRSGRPAAVSSGMLALWDFAEPGGTELHSTAYVGKLSAKWSGSIADSTTDGRDHFRIGRDAPSQPMDAYLDLGTAGSDSSIFTVEVKIDAAQFAGENANEQLRIGFTSDMDKPQVTARMIFGRDGPGRITLRGESLGGGTAIGPLTISNTNQLDRPIVLRLQVDTDADEYSIAYREASSTEFTSQGKGRVAAQREAKFLRLSALNDFAARDEYVNIDRIELRSD
jgi:gamma-glutamyltranspeptidase/glutathione hydrolase